MACDAHLNLAGIVKKLHSDLRQKYKRNPNDVDNTWVKHVKDKEKLSHYANAMHTLATTFWEKGNQLTRIDWCRTICTDFFNGDGLGVALQKDARRRLFAATKNDYPIQSPLLSAPTKESQRICYPFQGKIRLLDVGSCYNPFMSYSEFQAIGLDLHPAVESVMQCDFLQVNLIPSEGNCSTFTETVDDYLNSLKSPLLELKENIFHTVVFSLLLEYLPCPRQRLLCCLKAQRLLMLNGLLIIVTPDSHHVNKNASMMKSWRFAIESLGFRRQKYEKLEHIHGIAFRKIEDKKECDYTEVLGILSPCLYIPQDTNSSSHDDEEMKQNFEQYDPDLDLELPRLCDENE